MKTEKNILLAFILNLSFAVFEFAGGIFTGSVAITTDAIHDLGDSISIGASYFLEKKSKKEADSTHTYGYVRYSLLGSLITTLVLTLGSAFAIFSAVEKIINPSEINSDGMIIFAVVGLCVNFAAAFFTREGDSLNQKAVNLHMLEDVLGWAIVLVGSIVIRFTGFTLIDPLMSIGVAVFILINAIKNLKEITDIFLEKAPKNINVEEIKAHLTEIQGVKDIHHIHLRTLDGSAILATMHVVAEEISKEIKDKIREELNEHGIAHCTLEFEAVGEICESHHCHIEVAESGHGHHHHHHH